MEVQRWVSENKACPRVWELEEDTHPRALGPQSQIYQGHDGREKECNSVSALLLGHLLQKWGKGTLETMPRTVSVEVNKGCALVMAWPTPLYIDGGRDPCQSLQRGCNTFLQEPQDGS